MKKIKRQVGPKLLNAARLCPECEAPLRDEKGKGSIVQRCAVCGWESASITSGGIYEVSSDDDLD